ncbi:hypothetical protein DUZ99_15635 [Xylanibacillus composti]|uniref:Uncharacterized protein n=1 Tax=Xylanibacillus composti TaxID=1572762 RepID=A0A8J4M4P6_9BACL|nr:hypothetical protein [Xylanibacillus composti]MDT9726415.1 hypothetical protein [Xylanibacillus composti]GIQ71435.1 hypothetical protein XYCOK13_42590 [Xylanibacillus composti]
MLPQLNPIDLPARMPDEQDAGLQVFYALEQTTNVMAESLRKLPYDVLVRMDELSPAYMEAMLTEELTVAEALKELEKEFQTAYEASASE